MTRRNTDWFDDVYQFHRKFGCYIGTSPEVPSQGNVDLRKKLVQEEVSELFIAMGEDNLAEIADGVIDSIYVLLGLLVSYGIDARPIWDEVHRTNMAKEGGETRGDGKILKPLDWKPPNIYGLLANQGPLEDAA